MLFLVSRQLSRLALRNLQQLQAIEQQKQAEAERAGLHEQIIEAQRAALRELSTPLIPVSDNVVIMPLIGTIDTGRAQQVMETLLEGVAHYQARLAILDITGVSIVDTQVAQALIGAAQAVKLLGAQVILTGIQPQIAQTLVHLGVDLSGIETRGSLQNGIAYALRQR
jgi:rsbT co-antagonist protein RsbR